MPNEPFVFFALILGAAVAGFIGGWWQGGISANRNLKALRKAIENSNQIYMKWTQTDAGTSWEKGYRAGVTATLSTLEGFLKKAIPDDPS